MTELELFIDFHKESERQGPGSNDETLKALRFIDIEQFENMKIADIGCGNDGQTITFAQYIGAQITAVDLFTQFLNVLNKKSLELGLQNNIKTLEASMNKLPFEKDEFDLIWSERAIYNSGFNRERIPRMVKLFKDRGLCCCKRN